MNSDLKNSGKLKSVMGFLHLPKTGGTTLNYILRRSFGSTHVDLHSVSGRWCPLERHDLEVALKVYPKVQSMAGHWMSVTEDYAALGLNVDFFTFFRDPMRRCPSWYQYYVRRRGGDLSAEEFFAQENRHNVLTRRIAGEANADKAIEMLDEKFRFVGLTDKFNVSLQLLKEEFSEYPIDIRYRRQNTATDNTIKNEVKADDRVMEQIAETNQHDRAVYDYAHKRFLDIVKDRMIDGALDQAQGLELTRPSVSVALNRLKRNLIYKPALKWERDRGLPAPKRETQPERAETGKKSS